MNEATTTLTRAEVQRHRPRDFLFQEGLGRILRSIDMAARLY